MATINEIKISQEKYNQLVDWFRDLLYDSLVATMVLENDSHYDHYDKEQVEWIQDCEFEEYMEYYGSDYIGDDELLTPFGKIVYSNGNFDRIVDAFNEARNIEIENFYDDNKEYIW